MLNNSITEIVNAWPNKQSIFMENTQHFRSVYEKKREILFKHNMLLFCCASSVYILPVTLDVCKDMEL